MSDRKRVDVFDPGGDQQPNEKALAFVLENWPHIHLFWQAFCKTDGGNKMVCIFDIGCSCLQEWMRIHAPDHVDSMNATIAESKASGEQPFYLLAIDREAPIVVRAVGKKEPMHDGEIACVCFFRGRPHTGMVVETAYLSFRPSLPPLGVR